MDVSRLLVEFPHRAPLEDGARGKDRGRVRELQTRRFGIVEGRFRPRGPGAVPVPVDEAELQLVRALVRPKDGGAHALPDLERVRGGLVAIEAEVLQPREPARVAVKLHEHAVRRDARDDAVRFRPGERRSLVRHDRELGLEERFLPRHERAASRLIDGENLKK